MIGKVYFLCGSSAKRDDLEAHVGVAANAFLEKSLRESRKVEQWPLDCYRA